MLELDKILSWMFRCCGISPSGANGDWYLGITATVLLTSIVINNLLSSNTMNELLLNLPQSVAAIGVAGLITINVFKPESYRNIITGLQIIENEQQTEDKKQTRSTLWVTIATIFITLLPVMFQSSFYTIMSLSVIIVLFVSSLLQNILLVERIRIMFSSLNGQLANINAQADANTIDTTLDSVFRVHSSLQALVVDVDIHYCFFNLLLYTARFLRCVSIMYGYLRFVESTDLTLTFIYILTFVRQTVLLTIQAVQSHSCSQEANRTVLLAHRLLQPESALELWEKVETFSTLASHNKIHFTVGGIFTLDRALITQTFLTALSYLIIVMQLREVKLFGDIVLNSTASKELLVTNPSYIEG